MKYFIGFIVGVLASSMFFTWKLKQMTKTADDPGVEGNYVEEQEDESMPPDFLAFYQRFHSDSVYQMEHIVFPLQGLPSMADDATLSANNYRWQKEDWVLHQPFENAEGEFSRRFTKINDEMVIENIELVGGGYGMQRRWSKSGEDWYLIYYAGMNQLAQE